MPAVKEPKSIDEKPASYKPWQMPEIHLGSIVVVHLDGNDNNPGTAARVIHVNASSVDVILEMEDGRVQHRMGVAHQSDPRLFENPYIRENGTWEYSHDYKLLRDLAEKVQFLEGMLTK